MIFDHGVRSLHSPYIYTRKSLLIKLSVWFWSMESFVTWRGQYIQSSSMNHTLRTGEALSTTVRRDHIMRWLLYCSIRISSIAFIIVDVGDVVEEVAVVSTAPLKFRMMTMILEWKILLYVSKRTSILDLYCERIIIARDWSWCLSDLYLRSVLCM